MGNLMETSQVVKWVGWLDRNQVEKQVDEQVDAQAALWVEKKDDEKEMNSVVYMVDKMVGYLVVLLVQKLALQADQMEADLVGWKEYWMVELTVFELVDWLAF